MTTHAIEESKYFGAWQDALKGYKERDPAYLDVCKKKVSVAVVVVAVVVVVVAVVVVVGDAVGVGVGVGVVFVVGYAVGDTNAIDAVVDVDAALGVAITLMLLLFLLWAMLSPQEPLTRIALHIRPVWPCPASTPSPPPPRHERCQALCVLGLELVGNDSVKHVNHCVS